MDTGLNVVVGAGAAGIATAIALARLGQKTLLLEKQDRIGGTVANALIHTIGGLYNSQGDIINQGLPVELIDRLEQTGHYVKKRKIGRVWTLAVAPDEYQQVVETWIKAEANIELQTNTIVDQVFLENKQIVKIQTTSAGKVTQIPAISVVDTTGCCQIAQLIDANLAIKTDQSAMGLIFVLSGVDQKNLQFPQGLGLMRKLRKMAETGALPEQFSSIWPDMGIAPGQAYFKLSISIDGDLDDQQVQNSMLASAQKLESALAGALKAIPELAHAKIIQRGDYGVRDGGRIKGEYCLTKEDVLSGRKFDDVACRADWPIEYWNPVSGISLQYLDNNLYYEIPIRCLQVKGINNLWAAGKILSAEHLAQASARVVGTCWAMGEAVAKAIAQKIKLGFS